MRIFKCSPVFVFLAGALSASAQTNMVRVISHPAPMSVMRSYEEPPGANSQPKSIEGSAENARVTRPDEPITDGQNSLFMPEPRQPPTSKPGTEPRQAIKGDDMEKDQAPPIIWVEVLVDRPRDGEQGQLIGFLKSFIGKRANLEQARNAERMLLTIGRYRSAVCAVSHKSEFAGRLRCGLTRARTIRDIEINGLPLQLLEKNLRKRIFLRSGEILLPSTNAGRDRLARQKKRIIDYLEREGYYGADVEIEPVSDEESSDLDVKINIRNGRFVQVRTVNVKNAKPLKVSSVKAAFQAMCFSSDGLLEAFETGTFACFTRDRLRETKERLEETIREEGYPEGRVRIIPNVVDPSALKSDTRCGYTERQLKRFQSRKERASPKCIDLDIEVVAGPRLLTSLRFEDGSHYDDRLFVPNLPRFLKPAQSFAVDISSTFRTTILEPISRVVHFLSRDDISEVQDSLVYLSDLEDVFTFNGARSTDRTEAENTRLALLDSLASRGHFDANITMEYSEIDGNQIVVLYRINPGPVSYITDIHFIGNETFSSEELLNSAVLAIEPRPTNLTLPNLFRSFYASGFIQPKNLQKDADRILAFYESRGYRYADVRYKGIRQLGGRTQIEFIIDEGDPFVINSIELFGAKPNLIPQILDSILHCQNGQAAQEGRAPLAVEDCEGAPFLPDELEGDRRRIINVYVANGYLYTKVDIQPDFSAEGVHLLIDIQSTREQEGEPVSVKQGEIFVEGNLSTQQGVILREMDINEGSLRPQRIAEGVSKLRRTGLFSRVNYDYIGYAEEQDTVHLRVQVEERPFFTMDGSAGFSTDNLFSVRGDLRNRNVFGTMLDWQMIADLGLFIGRYSPLQSQVRYPRILGYPFDLKFTPALSYEDHPFQFVSRSPNNIGATKAVASWSAEDTRRRTLRLSNTVSLEWQPGWKNLVVGLDYEFRLDWDDAAAQAIQPLSFEAIQKLDGITEVIKRDPLQISTLSPRVTYRDVDNPFDPTTGKYAEASLGVGSPWVLNQDWLGLLKLRGALYYTIGPITLAGHGKTWLGFSYSSEPVQSALLDQELLALGGDRTIRGYSQDSIGIMYLAAQAKNGEDVSQGGFLGLAGALTNLELRFPMIRNLFIGDLKGAVFMDAGLVTHNDEELLNLDASRAYTLFLDPNEDGLSPRLGLSVGAGLRYVLPVGPISTDCAVSPMPPVSATAAVQFGCHLQLGYVF